MIGQISVSPDGKRIAWLDSGVILVTSFDNLGHSQRITAAPSPDGSCTESDLAWSPDSSALAFLSDCADLGGQSDLYLSHLDGNPPRRLSDLHGDVDAPAFSPDGKRIAFLYVEGATRPAGALAAMDAPSGVIGEDHVEVQRVAAVAASVPSPRPSPPRPPSSPPPTFTSTNSTGLPIPRPSPTSPPTRPVKTTGGSPNSTRNPLPGIPNPPQSSRPSDVSGPLHGLQIALPRWSPDGKAIAFIGGLMSDQGVTGGDVWIIDASGRRQPTAQSHSRPPRLFAMDRLGR